MGFRLSRAPDNLCLEERGKIAIKEGRALEQNQRYCVLSRIPLNAGFLNGKPARTFLPPSDAYAGFALGSRTG